MGPMLDSMFSRQMEGQDGTCDVDETFVFLVMMTLLFC
jgi:hypothetical protein